MRSAFLRSTVAAVLLTAAAGASAESGYNAGSPWLGWGYQDSGNADLPFFYHLYPNLNWAEVQEILPLTDGSAVVVGSTRVSNNGGGLTTGMVKLTPAGDPDPAFGTSGFQYGGGSDWVTDAAIDGQGQILALDGHTLCRFDVQNGAPLAFAGSNKTCIDIGTLMGNKDFSHNSLAVQPGDGRIVVAGFVYDMKWKPVIVRLKTDATLDPSFSGDGVTFVPAASYGIARIRRAGNGKLVFVGASGDAQPFIGRVRTDGQLDAWPAQQPVIPASWWLGDLVLVDNPMSTEDDIVVVSDPDGYIAKITGQTGTLDSSFGVNGLRSLQVDGKPLSFKKIAAGPNGTLLAAAWHSYDYADYEDGPSCVVRLTANGNVDPSFGVSGVSRLDYQGDNGYGDTGSGHKLGIAVSGNAVYAVRQAGEYFSGPSHWQTVFVAKRHLETSDLIFANGFDES